MLLKLFLFIYFGCLVAKTWFLNHLLYLGLVCAATGICALWIFVFGREESCILTRHIQNRKSLSTEKNQFIFKETVRI